jgi:hypothetical protein
LAASFCCDHGVVTHLSISTKSIMKTNRIIWAVMLSTLLFACKKEDITPDPVPNPNPVTSSMVIKFDHVWGPNRTSWRLNEMRVHPSTGDTSTFTVLNYYISNVRLRKADGSEYVQPESYHLVRLQPNAGLADLKLNNVPVGDYTAITYTIGVDSTRNVSGVQEGALSPSNGMFWSWNTGYIFVKAEGTTPHAVNGNFRYHIGGFSGANNAIRTVTHTFNGGTLRVRQNAEPSLHMFVNVARFWHGGIRLSSVNNVHMPGANAVLLADNFRDAFVFDHLHN